MDKIEKYIKNATVNKVFFIYIGIIFMYALIYYEMGNDHFNGINKYDIIDSLYLSVDIMSTCGSSNIIAKTKISKIIVISQQLCIIFLTVFVISNI